MLPLTIAPAFQGKVSLDTEEYTSLHHIQTCADCDTVSAQTLKHVPTPKHPFPGVFTTNQVTAESTSMSKPTVTAKEETGEELPEPRTSTDTLWQSGTAEWTSRKLQTG